jgi:hypothetical protein
MLKDDRVNRQGTQPRPDREGRLRRPRRARRDMWPAAGAADLVQVVLHALRRRGRDLLLLIGPGPPDNSPRSGPGPPTSSTRPGCPAICRSRASNAHSPHRRVREPERLLKYCSAFPGKSASLGEAGDFCGLFFTCYSTRHRHSGIGLHTPGPSATAPGARSAPAAGRSPAPPAPPARIAAAGRPGPPACPARPGPTSRDRPPSHRRTPRPAFSPPDVPNRLTGTTRRSRG